MGIRTGISCLQTISAIQLLYAGLVLVNCNGVYIFLSSHRVGWGWGGMWARLYSTEMAKFAENSASRHRNDWPSFTGPFVLLPSLIRLLFDKIYVYAIQMPTAQTFFPISMKFLFDSKQPFSNPPEKPQSRLFWVFLTMKHLQKSASMTPNKYSSHFCHGNPMKK